MAENKTSNRHLASWASVCNLFILLYRLLKASTMQVGLNVSIHSMKRTKISFSSGHSDQQMGGPYWACSHDGESLQNFVKDFFCNSDWAASVQPCSAAHDRTIWTSRRISRLARLVAALPLARPLPCVWPVPCTRPLVLSWSCWPVCALCRLYTVSCICYDPKR